MGGYDWFKGETKSWKEPELQILLNRLLKESLTCRRTKLNISLYTTLFKMDRKFKMKQRTWKL